jgi:dTDP-4-amino-4,6-dideoxygalactose transaminase
MFAFPPPSGAQDGPAPPFLYHAGVHLVNARSAIALLIERLTPRRVWIPSYVCGAVLDGIGDRAQVAFYGVNDRLVLLEDGWLADVSPGDVVMLIDYFGFPADQSVAAGAKERGAWVVRDACQALLSDMPHAQADFVVYSPRKFVGVPDGGILVSRAPESTHDWDPLEDPPADWWLIGLTASLGRRDFDLFGGERIWYTLYRKSEAEAPCGPYAMSTLTRALLGNAFDYDEIAARRVANYRHLARELGYLLAFPELPEGVVPLGCPIRHPDRDRLRDELFRHDIFPPVHWALEGIVPERFASSHQLSREIMTLPCDQRYGPRDMDRLAKTLLAAL